MYQREFFGFEKGVLKGEWKAWDGIENGEWLGVFVAGLKMYVAYPGKQVARTHGSIGSKITWNGKKMNDLPDFLYFWVLRKSKYWTESRMSFQQKSSFHNNMKLKVIIHEAEEGGYWAEVPAIPGCMTQGETFDELLQNIYEAVEGCLSIEIDESIQSKNTRVLEIAVWNKFQERNFAEF